MDTSVHTRLTDAERAERVERRAADLMAEAFRASPPKEAWWTEKEIAIRDRCFQTAQDEIELQYGAPAWRPPGVPDGDIVDWSLPPRQGLKRALADQAEATRLRDAAGEIADRARGRLAASEEALHAFGDLDRQIDAWHVEQARSGSTGALPYALAHAAKERSVATDQFDHAQRASATLDAELRAAVQRLQQCQRIVQLWAMRVILSHAEQLADELEAAQAQADQRRDVLNALAHAHFPHQPGPAPISRRVLDVLNAPPRGLEQNFSLIQPWMQTWLDLHGRLLADPDLVIDLA